MLDRRAPAVGWKHWLGRSSGGEHRRAEHAHLLLQASFKAIFLHLEIVTCLEIQPVPLRLRVYVLGMITPTPFFDIFA